MFGLQKCVHAFDAEFASPAALLDAAERALARGGDAVVDADGSGFERFHQAKSPREITREGVGTQAVGGIVCPLNRFGFGIEGEDWRDGRESFLGHAHRIGGNIGEDRGFEEKPLTFDALSATQQYPRIWPFWERLGLMASVPQVVLLPGAPHRIVYEFPT